MRTKEDKEYFEDAAVMSEREIDKVAMGIPRDKARVAALIDGLMQAYVKDPVESFRKSGDLDDLRLLSDFGYAVQDIVASYLMAAKAMLAVAALEKREIKPEEAN